MKFIIYLFLIYNITLSKKLRKLDDDVYIAKTNNDMTYSSLECTYFTDCFNCTTFSFKKCGWDGNKCYMISNSIQKIDLSEIENSCYNYYDNDYKTSRCGKLDYSFEGKKIKNISLKKTSSNTYNDPTMLCVYTINNTVNEEHISFEFELEIDNSAKVQYEVIYNDNKNDIVNINNEVETNFNNIKSLIIRFSSNYAFTENPFEIELENYNKDDVDDEDDDDEEKINILYIILIIIFILIIIIISIILFRIWYKKNQKMKIENNDNKEKKHNNIEIESNRLNSNNNKLNNDNNNSKINEDIKNNNNNEDDILKINKFNNNDTENPDSLITNDNNNENEKSKNINNNNNIDDNNNIINNQIQNNNNIISNEEYNLNQDKIIDLMKKNFNFIDFGSIKEKLDNKCSICIEEFVASDKVVITPCNHIFHKNCINNWLIKNNNEIKCPNCNHVFN
jgi:hypothetical protein